MAESWTQKVMAWGTIFLGVVGIGSLVLTYYSNNTNREALTSVQRAFVLSNTEYAIHRDLDQNGQVWRIQVSPILTNSGTTPAVDLRFYASGKVFDRTLPDNYGFADLPSSRLCSKSGRPTTVLGPKAQIEFCPVDVSTAEMIQVINRQRTLYVWGWATYHDIFKSTPVRRTEFCGYIAYADNSIFNPQIPPSHVMIGECGVHNCTDEQCSDYNKVVKSLP